MGKNDIVAGIRLEGEKEFKDGLTSVNKSLAATKSEMALVKAECAGQENSLESLTKKHEVLNKILQEQQKKVEATKAGLNHAKETYENVGKGLEDLYTELEKATDKMEDLEKIYGSSSQEALNQGKIVQQLNDAIEKGEVNYQRAGNRVKDWETKLNTAEAQVIQANKSLNQNAAYMKEAEQATDNCATSINKFGKEISDVNTNAFSANLKTMAVEKSVDVLEEVVKKAIEAGKYAVDVGSSFEAGMSEVAAISAASGEQLEKLTKKAKTLGSTTKFSATEAASAMTNMSLAGWSVEEILSGIDGVMQLAAASGMELADASQIVTDNISSFNLAASDATNIADMMAWAQANSSTTAAELGDAYGNCAANMNAAGQDIETTTSFLEALANNGLRGSEAGTSLAAVMRDMTSKMKDGSIAIGDTSVAVMDSSGNFRDMTDVLKDVEDATDGMGDAEKQAALMSTFTSDSIKGLNILLNAGADEVAGYEEQLRKCSGAASDMADVMEDNLKGDLTTAGSALEGLGIAAYEYIDGPVRSVVQGVTGIITGITDAITPQKTELELFVDEIKASNDEVQTLLDNAESTLSGATADVGTLEAYKTTLMELNEQERLTEFQKYQLANAVSELSNQIPGLADAFDSTTGSLNLTNEELAELFNNAEALAMQNALVKAQTQSYDALAQATLNVAKADSAVQAATDALTEANEKNTASQDYLAGGYGEFYTEVLSAEIALDEARKTQEAAADAANAAQKQIEEENEAFAGLREQFDLIPGATEGVTDAIEETGDAAGDAAQKFDEFGNNITGMTEEEAAAVAEASQKIVDAYENMKDGIASAVEGSISLFDEFSGGTEASASDMITNLDSQIDGITKWKENMETLAGELGNGMSQELYDKLAEMGPESANAVQALVDALDSETGEFEAVSQKWTEALKLQEDAAGLADYTSAGKEAAGQYVAGMLEGTGESLEAAQQIAQAGAEAVQQAAPQFQQAGAESAANYAKAFQTAISQASQSAGALASAARSAVTSYQNSFYNTGYNLSAGIASGMRAGQYGVSNAAAQVVREALAAAKRAGDIHSPSRKFRDEVGAQISTGMAFGISDKASLAGKAATKMSNKVYSSATSWLSKYKKKQQVSLADEKWYWEQVVKHTKKGTTAYNNALKKIQNISISELTATGVSSEAAKKITSNFGVSKTTGSGKNKKNKDSETYYSEIYTAAQKYLSNQQILNDWSLQQELAYWEAVKNNLKKGTQGWYDATKQIKTLQADIAEAETNAAEEKIKTQASVQRDLLDKYKVYYKVSAKAEMEYWNLARQQFKTGTDERIEADQKYLEACQDYYDQRKELDEEYAENSKQINDDLADSVKELQDTYKDAVTSRKQDILSSMNLFESWDATGYDGDTLLYNLKTQVAGLALWEQQLEELGKKGLSDALMEELSAMGPDAAANIYSLNQMTAEQLAEYNKLWTQKNDLANSQAIKDNAGLLVETNKEITNLRTEAQSELNALNADYRAALQELNTGISSELKNLVNKAGTIGEDAVSGLISGIGKAVTSVETYNSTTQVVDTISSQLDKLKEEGKVIGANALDGLLAAMQDSSKINSASQQVIQSIKRAMEEEAEIHSPSRLFRRETGPQIPAGLALGMEDGTQQAVKSAQEMMQETLAAAHDELEKQQATLQTQVESLSYSGIARLNRLTEQTPQAAPVVNIDNSTLATLLGTLINTVNGLAEKIDSQQLVLDTGVVAAQMQPLISQESAAITVRRNRGRY